ncbi:MAG: DNA polymerase III subunit delta [Bacteroidota bacterium]|nr:DNA polymerase III subunit delta [Bacteroidota bacterium]
MAKEKSDTASIQDLETSISQKKYFPLYYFFGDEDFLIDQFIKQIIRESVDESVKGFNVDIVDGNNIEVKNLLGIASAYPMISEKRVVVVKEFNKLLTSENNKTLIGRYLENPSESTIMLIIGSKLDNRTTIAKSIKSNGMVVEFKPLYDNQVAGWIKNHIKNFGKKITDEAAQLIAECTGNSMREIHNELEKLTIYVDSKKMIDEDDVNSVVGVSKAFNVFSLQKAIGEKDISKSVTIIENMLNNGESALGTIVMLCKYFQKLWIIRGSDLKSEFDIVSRLKINQFFVKEYLNAARNYSIANIEQAFVKLVETDESLKSSSIDEKLAMTLLIYNIIGKRD